MAQSEIEKCGECGRTNGPSAVRCLWCGAPLLRGDAAAASFTTSTVELDYLDGIERFDNPAPVRLTVTATGIEMKEILPGTRTFHLNAEAILGVDFTDASVAIEQEPKRSLWGWLMLNSGSAKNSKKTVEIKHDYILTIRYGAGEETKTAVFHREDSLGLSYVKNITAIITALIHQRAARGEGEKGRKGEGGG